MIVAIETPGADDVTDLLTHHLEELSTLTPPEFSFALPVDALLADGITFWTVRDSGRLMGFGALKDLGDGSGEVKSMRTAPEHMRKGVGAKLLEEIISAARTHRMITLYLETGVTDAYLPARVLYEKYGFSPCAAFADYAPSDHNWFMKLDL